MAAIRAAVPFYERDRYMADDIGWAQRAVAEGAFAPGAPIL